MSDARDDERPQRRARDQAIAAFVPAGLPLWVACVLDELLPLEPWWEWAPAEFWQRPDIVAARQDEDLRELRETLVDRLGSEHADAFMAYLSPVPWPVLFAAGLSRPRTGADERPRCAPR